MIQSIHEAGFSPLIYDVSFFVSLLIATIAAFFYAKRLKIKRGTAVLCVPFVWLFSYLCACLVMYAETDFSIFDCGYNIKCFVFIPVGIWVFSRVFKVPFTLTSDLIAPLVLHSARNCKHRVHFLRLLLRLSIGEWNLLSVNTRPAFPRPGRGNAFFFFCCYNYIHCDKEETVQYRRCGVISVARHFCRR